MKNYCCYHLHSYDSLRDSTTPYSAYVKRAAELGMTAIGTSEHGIHREWFAKQQLAHKAGLKFLLGVEAYLSPTLEKDKRIGQHTILIARNKTGGEEINELIFQSTDEEHFYYNNRISYDEFLKLSDNVIAISACLASPLNNLDYHDPYYAKLVRRYDFLEIQPHVNSVDQIRYNQSLALLADEYNKPLIAGTDTHNLGEYESECRKILLAAKKIKYSDEDTFNLNFRIYDELVNEFEQQDSLPSAMWMQAIENTNVLADMVTDWEMDCSPKYPILHGSPEADAKAFRERVEKGFSAYIESGTIKPEDIPQYRERIEEEFGVIDKLKMGGFLEAQADFECFIRDSGMPIGPGRGSVGGSLCAYMSGITDCDSLMWKGNFRRFISESRVELGDIDCDVSASDRPKIFEYIISRVGREHAARVPSFGKIQELSAIDDICRALSEKWDGDANDNPYSLANTDVIKQQFKANPDETRLQHPDIFKYYDGMQDVSISQSVHPAGIVAANNNLIHEYGGMYHDGEIVLLLSMDSIHDLGLPKFDLLILRNVEIIDKTCKMAGIKYPRVSDIDMRDAKVWDDITRSPVGVFQFESDFGFASIRKMKPRSVEELSELTAALRPTGAEYRDMLINRIDNNRFDKNTIEILKSSGSQYVFFQEQIMALLVYAGFSPSESDSVRRSISKKNQEAIEKEIPRFKKGFIERSPLPEEQAEKEAELLAKTIVDSAGYGFNIAHGVEYSLLTYFCIYLRYHYPLEFCTAYLQTAANDSDLSDGVELAGLYGINVLPTRFGHSGSSYTCDKATNTISKGTSAIKGLNAEIADALYELSQSRHFDYFSDLIIAAKAIGLRSNQLEALIETDYFSDFGNIRKLLNIRDFVEFLKYGEAKSVKKEKAGIYEPFIAPYSTDKTKAGKPAASYTIEDMTAILHGWEDYQRRLDPKDLSLSEKALLSKKHLGYLDITTGKKEDRSLVIVNSKVVPLKSKKTGKTWAYAADFCSIGSGKTVRASVISGMYEHEPFKEGDVLRVKHMTFERNQYWTITQYQVEL